LVGNRYRAERTPLLLAGDTRENEIQDVFTTT
jgi:hypothetical protein